MITLDEFRAMKPGTIFYVAAPGRIGLEANNLSEECFHKVLDFPTHNNTHLKTDGGGISFSYGKDGASFYRTLEEAQEFMAGRHIRIHKHGIMRRAAQIEKLKEELALMDKNGPGEPDYIFHKRSGV